MNFITSYFKKLGLKRVLMTLIGNVFIGIGIGLFKWSNLGTDPFTALNSSASEVVQISYPVFQIFFNLGCFVIQLIWGRHLIGLGTVVNAFLLGYIVQFFQDCFTVLFGIPMLLWIQVILVVIGIVICSFGLSLYQTADAGVAPYDALSLITQKKLPRIPYFWHRMFDDALAALVAFLARGFKYVGIGSLVAAFGFGPFIHFFNKHFSEKLLRK